MSIILRPYQETGLTDIFNAWSAGHQNVLYVAATGSGKTVTFSEAVRRFDGPAIAIAHRQELVGQISLALARNGIRHRIVAPDSVIRFCVSVHMRELKRSYYDANARVGVAGVDTLIRRTIDRWLASVRLVVMDECHHVLKANKWGAAFDMFPQAVGLGVTATPCRADGRGLGRHADGVFDTMILAPTMRDMIEHGYLTDYRIFAPPSDLDLSTVPVAASGEYSPDPLRKAVHKSHIVGDVVEQYLKIAPGKLGVTFSVNVESATDQAAAFRQAGTPAEVVSAKTPDAVRASILRKFAGGEIKQLVNVDLFGEGFDLPAIETVCMARPTQSFSLFSQQFGRALRTMPCKAHAIIIDHVQNIHRHGLPDAPQRWTLDRREKRSRSSVTDAAAVRTCPECTAVYLRELGAICPYCSHEALPPGRSSPAQVDGDLYELDAETLRQLRGEIDKPPVYPVNATPVVVASINKNHRLKSESQAVLRETMAYWAAGMDDIRLAQRRFFIKFGVDVMTAQTLNKSDAELLTARLIDDIVNRT